MRALITTMVAAAAMLAQSAAHAQEVAGRVLAVAGSVNIQRGTQTINARPGTEIRSGDTLDLGPSSNTQVRFSDESLVALGPETTFRVTEYRYQGQQPGTQRAFLDLIKGGFRTVTGLIGRANHTDYKLVTPSAILGIRGTNFAACQDCTGLRGQKIPGLIALFTQGSGVMSTKAGEILLGTGQSGQATSPDVAPQRTLSMPPTQQQANARPTTTQQAEAQKQAAPAAVVVATASQSSVASDASTALVASTSTSTTTTQSLTASTTTTTTSTPPVITAIVNNPPTTITNPAFSGTVIYQLNGPFNIPTTCSGGGSCSNAVAGTMTLGVNYSLNRATFNVALKTSTGEIFNAGIPITLSGVPITIQGDKVTFSGTFKLSDFPQSQGAFRCSQCGVNNTPGFLDQINVSGTITASSATLTFGGSSSVSGSGSLTATLPLATSSSNLVAATVSPILAATNPNAFVSVGRDTRSTTEATVDSAGRLLSYGPVVGGPAGSVGGATNTLVGSDATAGNLAWGVWVAGSTSGAQATITDSNYNTFNTNSSLGNIPWITGQAPTSLPTSLGTLSFTPMAAVFSNSSQFLSSASLTADFINRSLTIGIVAVNTLASTATSWNNIYTMNATTGFSPTNGRFSAVFNSVTCAGPCNSGQTTVTSPTGSMGGFFSGSGSTVQGAGVAFTAGFGANANSSTGQGVNGVIAFKRN